MKVTSVEEMSKSRSKIFLDDEFAFVLYKGELRLFGVEEGKELSGEAYTEIMEVVLPKRAKLRAMNLLKSREYTEKQLRNKLKQGLYPEPVIEKALEYVAGYHYTDDLRYAVTYIADHETTRSRLRIEQDLIAKGIDRATLEQAWARWEEQGGNQDELKMMERLLQKRGYHAETAGYKEKQKTYSFLVRKGFAPEAVLKVINMLDISVI